MRGKSVVVSTVWSYEPVRRAWYSESGLATPRKNFGLVVHRMALYAIGGQDKKGRCGLRQANYDVHLLVIRQYVYIYLRQ